MSETLPKRESDDGMTPLAFYAYVIRTLGVPREFRLCAGEWIAEAPFTPPSDATLALLESHGV